MDIKQLRSALKRLEFEYNTKEQEGETTIQKCEDIETKIKIFKKQKKERHDLIKNMLHEEENKLLQYSMQIEEIKIDREKLVQEKEAIQRNQQA